MVAPSIKAGEQQPEAAHTEEERQGYLGIQIARLVAAIPFFFRSILGWCLGYAVGVFPSRERRMADLQIKAFLPEKRSWTLTPRVFANAGRTAVESLSLRPIIRNHARYITCDSWQTVEAWLREDRPIVTLTAHTGNWDLLAGYVISRGIPLTTIGREARNPQAQAVLRWIREGYGIETIWRSDKAGLKRLVQCLKERRVVAALIDQDTKVESIPVPFFGQPAKTPVSLITLGRKFNARFVSAFLFRTGWFRFSVFVEEIPDGLTEEDVLKVYNDRLEQFIRDYPDQWVWFHKRWRTTPQGITLSTKEYAAALEARIKNRG
jgi:KDO2-lipid IV(A) lauroyltransferase